MNSRVLTALIIINVVVYVLVVAANFLNSPLKELGVFVSTVGGNSDKYEMDITPSGWVFSIWGVIYIWEALWIIFSLVNICRKTENGPALTTPLLLPPEFFAVFIINMLFNLGWLFLWDREHIEAAFVFLFLISATTYVCLFISYKRLNQNLDVLIKYNRKTDIWLIRILVQNGISTYAAWTTIATLINMGVVIAYTSTSSISPSTAGTVALSILSAEIVAFAIADFFFLDNYTRYTVTPYLVVVLALGGSLAKNYTAGATNTIITLVLMGVACLLLVVKFVLLVWRHNSRPLNVHQISESKEQIQDEKTKEVV